VHSDGLPETGEPDSVGQLATATDPDDVDGADEAETDADELELDVDCSAADSTSPVLFDPRSSTRLNTEVMVSKMIAASIDSDQFFT